MLCKKLMTIVATVMLLAGSASAALEYSWDYDDGTAMGWIPLPTGTTGCTVKWYGFKDPPDNTISNWGLGMNNDGDTEQLKWEIIQKEITPGEQYRLAFDYKAGGEGTHVRMYFWDSDWNGLGSQVVYDYMVWGTTPSLDYNGGVWTHRDVAIDAAHINAKYVTIQLNHRASWGQTIFDEVEFYEGIPGNMLSNGGFNTGADGWTPDPNDQPSNVYWRSDLGNPGGCLAMDNLGGVDQLKWESHRVTVTNDEIYSLIFDYKAAADGVYVAIHFYDTSGMWLAVQNLYDYTAWGWAPSLNPTGGVYSSRAFSFPASVAGHTVGAVMVRLHHLASWTETRFDNLYLAQGLPPIDQDLNGDGVVNLADFAELAGNWQQEDLIGVLPEMVLEDAESYADQAAIEETWIVYSVPGDSTLTLLTNPADAHSGNQAVRWEYDLLGFPDFYAEVYFTFEPAVNLSLYDELRVWLNRHPGNGQEDLFYVRFFAPAGPGPEGRYADMLLAKAEGSTYSPEGWSEWVVDLHNLNNWYGDYNDLSDITDVGGLLFGTYTASGGGSGTIDFDDIRLLDYNPSCDPENTVLGDLSGDCDVDFEDLGIFASQWMYGL